MLEKTTIGYLRLDRPPRDWEEFLGLLVGLEDDVVVGEPMMTRTSFCEDVAKADVVEQMWHVTRCVFAFGDFEAVVLRYVLRSDILDRQVECSAFEA